MEAPVVGESVNATYVPPPRSAGEVLLLAASDRACMLGDDVLLGEEGRSTEHLLKGMAIPSRDRTVDSSPPLLLPLTGLLAGAVLGLLAAVADEINGPPAMPKAQSVEDNLLNFWPRMALEYDPIRFNSNST